VRCNILYKRDDLRLNICACYSWEIALDVGLDASFDNTQDCKGIQEKAGEINNMKAYMTNHEIFRLILNGCYTKICEDLEL
jgi:hypothetical protein